MVPRRARGNRLSFIMQRLVPRRVFLMILWGMLPLVVVAALMTGPVILSPDAIIRALAQFAATPDAPSRDALIVFEIRAPRVLLAASVGLILAICGAALQGLFRNPLADPSLIGVSSGASVGASLVIVLAGTWSGLPLASGLGVVAAGAFLGGALATLLVYRLATSAFGTSVNTMLLAGIAVSAIAGAVNGLLGYLADNEMLRQMSLWQMGALGTANWPRALMATGMAVLLGVWLPREARALDALLLGESEARHLGVDVQRLKRRLILVTALGVGTCIAMAGAIAFVGLMVPHLVRLAIGPGHAGVVPGSALGGALLLVLADAAARVVIAPAELPTGIITALLGAPFFVALLLRQRRSL